MSLYKSITIGVLMCIVPTLVFTKQPEHKTVHPANSLKAIGAPQSFPVGSALSQNPNFHILKKIATEQQFMEREHKGVDSLRARRSKIHVDVNSALPQAEFLGRKIPFRKAPGFSPRENATGSLAKRSSVARIQNELTDTVYVRDKVNLTFAFGKGYISAILTIYYDADRDGLISDQDIPIVSNVLLMDNDEHDEDAATGTYSLQLQSGDLPLTALVGSFILSVDNFESVSNSYLVVLQKQEPSMVHIVTDPPIPELIVMVYATSEETYVFTDSTGQADFHVNRSTVSQLQIRAYFPYSVTRGYIPAQPQTVNLTEDMTDVVFTFTKASSFIQGTYVDDTGRPISHGSIYASGPEFTTSTMTDSIGAFVLGVESGQWYVEAEPPSPEYMTSYEDTWISVGPRSTMSLNLMSVKANSSISGSVKYGATGVGGIPVKCSLDMLHNTVLTKADGSYSLPVRTPSSGSSMYAVYVILSNYLYYIAASSPTYASPGDQNVNFDLVKATGGVTGRVFDDVTMKPLAGVSIEFSGPVYAFCVTDDSGSYRIPLRDGTYSATFYLPKYFNGYLYGMSVSGAFVIRNILLHPSGSISGTILDKTGKPIPNAYVSAADSTGLSYGYGGTDEFGRYLIDNLRTSRYVVRAEAPGYMALYYSNAGDRSHATQVSVEEGSDTPNIDFVLSNGGSISGKVMDKAGMPILNAFITAYDSAFNAWSHAYTDEYGSYLMSTLSTGDYMVNASAYGYVSVWYNNVQSYTAATRVHVVEDQTTTGIDLTMSKGGSISGYVRDEQKEPMPYATVYLQGTLTPGLWIQYTDMSGKYSFSGLPPGAYQASAQQTNYDLQWFDHKTTIETADTIKLSMEENRTGIDFDLSRGVGIYGFIDDAMTGYGIPGVEVRVASNGGYNAIVYSDYDGAYGAMLPAGSYTICILVRNGTYACRYYYNSAGPVVCEKDAEPVTIMPDAYRRADFHIQADKRDFVSTRSNLGVTMTNRGVLGEYSDTTTPSCRWTCGEGKDYLFEGDLWVGASFAGTKRLFGDMYVVNGGAWRAATNFTETSMADHQSVETYFYNADYTMSPPMVCTLVNQGLESWPNTDFVLVRYSLFVDDAGVSSVPRISDVNAGLFLDFDVSRGAQHDLVGIDTTLRMIYVYDGTGEDSTYIGVCALGPSPTRLNWWMADNDTMYRTESQKEMGLLTNVGSSVPDIQADYRVLVSTGPFELKPGDSVALPLALVVGKGKAGIRAAAQNAKEKYNSTMTEVNTRAFVGPPTAFALYQNYPNPFNPSTNIMFDLPRSSHVTVKVYNVIGQEVCTVVDDVRPAGHYSMQWSGASLASGVYFCTLQTDSFAQTRKMLLMK